MGALITDRPFKPTRHNFLYPPRWQWVRDRCLGVWMFWERGASVAFNIASGKRVMDYATFWQSDTWAYSKYGPGLLGNALAYADTNHARIGSVGLFAASTEKWTLCVRASFTNNVQSFIVGRGGSTANRAFSLQHNRPGAPTQTPGIRIRGGTALGTDWGLDDGRMHTYWITWDGATCLAYYDSALGGLSVNVGTAVEEPAETILLGAVTTAAPFGEFTGIYDFAAILDQPLSPDEIREWHTDLYAPWRPWAPMAAMSFPIQTIRPASDIAAGGWTTDLGGTTNLFASVDEAVADDADYIQSPVDPSAAAVELKLGTAQTPSYSGGGTLHLRHRRA